MEKEIKTKFKRLKKKWGGEKKRPGTWLRKLRAGGHGQ